MILTKLISKLIKILHSDGTAHGIALGFALGAIIGLTPTLSLHNLIIFTIIFILNVSLPAVFLSILIFSGFAYLLDPYFHNLGYYLLVEVAPLKLFWTYLYNLPVAPLFRFYNTVVLGSLVVAVLAQLPLYLCSKYLVIYYRQHLKNTVEQLKIAKIIKGNKLVKLYQKAKSLGVNS